MTLTPHLKLCLSYAEDLVYHGICGYHASFNLIDDLDFTDGEQSINEDDDEEYEGGRRLRNNSRGRSRSRSISQKPRDASANRHVIGQDGDGSQETPSFVNFFNPFSTFRGLVSRKKRRFKVGDHDLDLAYITSRIIAMGYPSTGVEAMYRNTRAATLEFLEKHHGNEYKVYNLCIEPDRDYPPSVFFGRAIKFGFEDHCPPPMRMLVDMLMDMRKWLVENENRTLAIHCKAGKGRTGTVICALLLLLGIGKPSGGKWVHAADRVLKLYGFARSLDGKGVTIPAQIMTVRLFGSFLDKVCEMVPNAESPDVAIEHLLSISKSSLGRIPIKSFRNYPLLQINQVLCGPWYTFHTLRLGPLGNNGNSLIKNRSNIRVNIRPSHHFYFPPLAQQKSKIVFPSPIFVLTRDVLSTGQLPLRGTANCELPRGGFSPRTSDLAISAWRVTVRNSDEGFETAIYIDVVLLKPVVSCVDLCVTITLDESDFKCEAWIPITSISDSKCPTCPLDEAISGDPLWTSACLPSEVRIGCEPGECMQEESNKKGCCFKPPPSNDGWNSLRARPPPTQRFSIWTSIPKPFLCKLAKKDKKHKIVSPKFAVTVIGDYCNLRMPTGCAVPLPETNFSLSDVSNSVLPLGNNNSIKSNISEKYISQSPSPKNADQVQNSNHQRIVSFHFNNTPPHVQESVAQPSNIPSPVASNISNLILQKLPDSHEVRPNNSNNISKKFNDIQSFNDINEINAFISPPILNIRDKNVNNNLNAISTSNHTAPTSNTLFDDMATSIRPKKVALTLDGEHSRIHHSSHEDEASSSMSNSPQFKLSPPVIGIQRGITAQFGFEQQQQNATTDTSRNSNFSQIKKSEQQYDVNSDNSINFDLDAISPNLNSTFAANHPTNQNNNTQHHYIHQNTLDRQSYPSIPTPHQTQVETPHNNNNNHQQQHRHSGRHSRNTSRGHSAILEHPLNNPTPPRTPRSFVAGGSLVQTPSHAVAAASPASPYGGSMNTILGLSMGNISGNKGRSKSPSNAYSSNIGRTRSPAVSAAAAAPLPPANSDSFVVYESLSHQK